MVLKLNLTSVCSFKFQELQAVKPILFDRLLTQFTYTNPDYIKNERMGFSNASVDPLILTYFFQGEHVAFGLGSYTRVKRFLEENGISVQISDNRIVLPDVEYPWSKVVLRDDQKSFVNDLIKSKNGIGLAFTSFGKCHEKGTKILLHNGSVKKVENIKVGDLVMGPDSKPRNVLASVRGSGDLYKITPIFGEPFIVNHEHVLSLKATGNNRHESPRTKNKDKWLKGSIHNIPLNEYLTFSEGKKHILKLWRTGVEFSPTNVEVDPYFVGVWLGDGSRRSASITCNNEKPIVDYLYDFANKNDYVIREQRDEGKCPTFHLVSIANDSGGHSSPIRKFVKTVCSKNNEKHIPKEYMINSREVRLQVLAGIIDTDGHLINDKRTYEVTCKKPHLASQIIFLARSLGFSARFKRTKSSYRKNGERKHTGHHYRISISGQTYLVPVKLERKMAEKREARTNHLTTGFTVEKVDSGDYFGFTLDGDHLYLTADFIVHHNTLSILEAVRKLKQPALIIVHTEFLAKQWIKEATNPKTFNMPMKMIGGCGGPFLGKERLGQLNIALYHSLSNPDHLKRFVSSVGVVVLDEGQKSPIDAIQKCVRYFKAQYRWAVTAQVKRKDAKEFITLDTFGNIVHEAVETSTDSKILSRIYLLPTDYSDPEYEWDKQYSGLISRMSMDIDRNTLILKRAYRKVQEGNQVIIFVERKAQAFILASALKKKDVRVGLLIGKIDKESINGLTGLSRVLAENYDDKKSFDYISKAMLNKEIDIVIGTQKAEVGLSIRTLNHAIITTPVANSIESVKDRLNQMIGRVERTHGDELEEKFGVKPTPTVDILVDINISSLVKQQKFIKQHYGKRVTTLKKG